MENHKKLVHNTNQLDPALHSSKPLAFLHSLVLVYRSLSPFCPSLNRGYFVNDGGAIVGTGGHLLTLVSLMVYCSL